jgi:hypothetical protein
LFDFCNERNQETSPLYFQVFRYIVKHNLKDFAELCFQNISKLYPDPMSHLQSNHLYYLYQKSAWICCQRGNLEIFKISLLFIQKTIHIYLHSMLRIAIRYKQILIVNFLLNEYKNEIVDGEFILNTVGLVIDACISRNFSIVDVLLKYNDLHKIEYQQTLGKPYILSTYQTALYETYINIFNVPDQVQIFI